MTFQTTTNPSSPTDQATEPPPSRPTWWAGRGSSRILVTTGVLAGWALLAAWWTPRGPVTTAQALTAMVVGLLLGAVAGLTLRSRWAMLLAPLVFVVVFELARLGTVGLTAGPPHASTYGLIGLAVGRGVHGLLALAPMVLGASLGATVARRRARSTVERNGRRGVGSHLRTAVTVVTAVAVTLLGLGIARPADTAAIVDAGGAPVAGSVAELTRVDINGHELAMMVRGRSTNNPVLLFLAGGPGGTELGAMRHHGQDLEADFTVVTLDQRGAGRSYGQLDPTSTLTLDSAVADVFGVADYLRARFGQDKVYLVGQSWGTILAVLAAQERPDLFHAVIGAGQMVSIRATDTITYRDTLAWADQTGNAALVDQLTASGPPPYTSMLDYEPALAHMSDVYPYDHSGNAEGAGEMSEGLLVGEYSLLDKLHVFAGFLDTFGVLYPQLQGIDFRTDVPRLEVPAYLFQGRYETPGRAVLAEEWFSALDAPAKELVVAETSGHRSLWEQPAQFHTFMTDTVLAGTSSP